MKVPFVPTFEQWLRGWRQAPDQTGTIPSGIVNLEMANHIEQYHYFDAMRRYMEYVASLTGEKVAR